MITFGKGKKTLQFGHLANITILVLGSLSALKASPHQLDTISYNFGLAGGGGGSAAKLDRSLDIEIFCVDFANEIIVPQNNYSANLTPITSFGFTNYKFFQELTRTPEAQQRLLSPRIVGMIIISFGLTALIMESFVCS